MNRMGTSCLGAGSAATQWLQGMCSVLQPQGGEVGEDRWMLAASEVCFYVLDQKHEMKNSYFSSDLIFGSRSEKKR